jgi:diguanylate cyclase (GGDEF)-like protein
MDVRTALGLDQVLDPLDVFRPDVITVSTALDGILAASVVAVVRQDDRHLAMAVVELCGGVGAASPSNGGEALPRVFVGDRRLPYLIREHGRRTRRLGEGSIRDELTGILTTSRFRERLDHEVARCLRHGLVVSMGVVEVNDFGALNERNGRVSGGRVMATLAQVLRTRLRRTDIIGRLGVDLVGVLMPHTTSLMAQRVMEQAREQMGSVRFTGKGGKLFTVTLSGGISTCPVHVQPSQLQQAALRALEEARAQGSSRVVREEDLDRR